MLNIFHSSIFMLVQWMGGEHSTW